jgi:hypothetical protein
MISRRKVSLAMLLVLGMAVCGPALAKDDGNGGNDGGESDGGGRGDGGKDDSGRNDGGKDDGGDTDSGNSDTGSGGQPGDGDDDDRIRRAVRSGQAKPLRQILKSVRSRYDGQVVRVRLTRQAGALLYRIRMIDSTNRLIDVVVEAASGRVVTPSGIY